MVIIINISSKSYNSLSTFVKKFLNKKFMSKLKIVVKKSKSVNPTKSILYTVLKSPHVNKTAQEQFVSKTFNVQFELFLYQPHLFFLFFKIIKNTLISDISINYKIVINKTMFKKKIKTILNPTRFDFYFYFTNEQEERYKLFLFKRCLKLNEGYGEFLLKNKKVII